MADDMKPDPQTSLYETDFYAWTQQQAERLRRAMVEASPEGIDWRHVAEEIEDMGKRDCRGAKSEIEHIIAHLLKLRFSPNEQAGKKWVVEVEAFRSNYQRIIDDSPGLVPKIQSDLDKLQARAAGGVQREFELYEPDTPVDTSLRWTLDQILGEADDPLDA